MATVRQRRILPGAVVLFAAAAVQTGRADVIVSIYQNEMSYHFQRVGIPDIDQERVGLANLGACHCVPACTLNLLIYAGGHGFPAIEPGPGAWGGSELYLEATEAISDLGQEMAICYGDGDAGVCDPTVCDPDGDCVTSCGSRTAWLATHGLKSWLGDEADKFTLAWFASKGNLSLRLHHVAQAAVLPGAPLMRVNYGRYNIVAFTPEGEPIYRRAGGHAMSFVGCEASGGQSSLWTRDPAQSESPVDLFGQSPFATMAFDVTDMLVRVTEQNDGGPIVSWYTRWVSALDWSPGDAQLVLLDVVASILPKACYSWSGSSLHMIPLGDAGFGIEIPPPASIAVPLGMIIDAVPDPTGVGVIVLALPPTGPPLLARVNLANGTTSHAFEVPDAVAVASGRLHDLFVAASDGAISTIRRFEPTEGGDLGAFTEGPIALTLPFAVHGITYDDANDQLVIASTSAGRLIHAPRDLGASGEPVTMTDIPTTVPAFGRASLAIEPGTTTTWMATAGSDSVFGLTVRTGGGVGVEEIARADVVDPTGVTFDDAGRLHVRTTSGVIVLRRTDVGGPWERDEEAEAPFVSVPLGSRLVMQRSRVGFDAQVHDNAAWDDLDPTSLPDIGTIEPDCRADIDGDGAVGVSDLLAILAAWGPNPGHPADLDGDGDVGVGDLLDLLAAWGPC